MIQTQDIQPLRQQIRCWRQAGERIGFVPTMGNLHRGHLTLVREARRHCDRVVVSIFVNPMQFNQASDLENYPRTPKEDCDALAVEGVDLVFLPTPAVMYPKGLTQQTQVEVPGLSERLEGASRPGHFRGVATVVTKLFNLVQPDVACFGQKDYQQLALIRQMVEDLAMSIEVIGVPTVREADGLAMSSRNNRLSGQERQVAPRLHQILTELKASLAQGAQDLPALIEQANQQLEQAGFRRDRIDICNARTLEPATADDKDLVILAAAHLGPVRLIDNLEVKVKG